MYFPYLRGKQSEMLAIRELIEKNLIGDKIIPVIEPIKFDSTLSKTLDVYIKNNRKIAFIMDSKLTKDKNDIDNYISCNSENIIRLYLSNSISNKILLEDSFIKRKRNADYLDIDEFFSNNHIYFQDKGYEGFSDYSIIGDEYLESGFLPYAVAIHIVYFDENKELRIKHFVSDSNKSRDNIDGKFKEAVYKLNKWIIKERNKSNFIETYALGKFIDYYNEGHFPGLTMIKRLSIIHHLELVNKFLEGDLDK